MEFETAAGTADVLASIIYVLTNESMPGLIKIGRTSGDGVGRRVAELSRPSGVPLPFKVSVARAVHDAEIVEKALHIAFAPERINPSREFFTTAEHRAVAIINAFPGRDLTPQTEIAAERAVEAEEPGSVAASRSCERKRRPPLNFEFMGIPLGSVLTHAATGRTVQIVEPKKVRLDGEVMSLTRAQQTVTGLDYAVQPGRHWFLEGRSLDEFYEAAYPLEE